MAKLNPKCAVVNANPDTGMAGPADEAVLKSMRFRMYDPESDPRTELRAIRKKVFFGPLFGINCGIDVTGIVRVGDPVYVWK